MTHLPPSHPVLNERYHVLARTGGGGMGEVYRTLDTATGEIVAVKLIRDDLSDEAAERFDREANTLADLQHPAIVRFLDHGRTPAGKAFLVMEWLDGCGLDVLLARQVPPLQEALELGQRVASALAVVHRAGLIHRDIKPGNLLLVDNKPARAKLIDFGLVRGGQLSAMTQVGVAVGTPGYMAPEQIRGVSAIDWRADLYALGCILFELLTGRRPYGMADSTALLTRVLFEDTPRVSSFFSLVPPALDQLVASLLARSPDERPASATAVMDALAEVARTLPDAPSGRPQSIRTLGQAEARNLPVVLCRLPSAATVVMAGAPAGVVPPSSIPVTITQPDAELGPAVHARDMLAAIVAPFGGVVRMIRAETVAVTVRTNGTAKDQAERALRCALAIRKGLAVRPLAIAMIRQDDQRSTASGDAEDPFAPAIRLLRQADGEDVVRMDEVTGMLLAHRRGVARTASGHWLDPAAAAGPEVLSQSENFLPCMGRDRELSNLEGLWAECIDEEQTRVVLVTGVAGVGKSRLVREFAYKLAATRVGTTIWLSPTDELGAGTPYGVIERALARAAGVSDLELAGALPRWKAWLANLVPAAEVDSVAQTLLGLGSSSPGGGETLIASALQPQQSEARIDQNVQAVERVLAGVCARSPLVWVLEDLHWADPSSLRLLDHLLRRRGNLPWLVIGVSRPELFDTHPRLWEHAAPHHVALGALAPKAAARLVKAVLGEQLDDQEAQRLVEHSGGNAFYLEELIRAVREGRGGSIPPNVLATVESRLLGLDPEARRLLRAASVLGQAFTRDGVVAVLGGEDRDIDERAWLSELVRTAILREGEKHGQFRFAHALVHEAAYAMLTDEDRPRAHLAAADFLREQGTRQAAKIAHHYGLGGDLIQSARFSAQAARQALLVGDKESARSAAEQAIAMGDNEPFVGEAHFVAAEACRQLGASEDARRHTVAAVALLPTGTPMWYAAQRTVVMVGMSSFYGKR
ncbi:MAG: protein kinase domain-containing protein [Myxococcota bacterium]